MYQCEWDRFDIVAAHYCYCVNWHSGQWSKEYARLSKIASYSRNMPTDLKGLLAFSDNSAWIYLNLVEKNHSQEEYMREIEEYEDLTD